MTKQDYGAKPVIEGVKLEPLTTFYSDDGSFTELFRLEGHERLQLNHSILLPGAVKALHRHQKQTCYWHSWEPLLVGLRDDREDSPTFQVVMRFILCNQSLKIPIGVAHGASNLTPYPVSLIYGVTEFFNPEDPDEERIPPEELGDQFWIMSKG